MGSDPNWQREGRSGVRPKTGGKGGRGCRVRPKVGGSRVRLEAVGVGVGEQGWI